MYATTFVSYTKWKALKTALTATAYYIQEEVRYIPFLVSKTAQHVYRTEVMRDITQIANPNLADFETNIKPGATVEDSIDDGIADEIIP